MAALGTVLTMAVTASAAPITPTFDSFGSFPTATFGGTGIPTDAVAVTTIGSVTLALTAHQRYDNVAVTNDGAGTFYAALGEDANTTNPVAGYATWNFGFFIQDTSTSPSGGTYRLFWDFDPALDNDRSTHGFAEVPLSPGHLNQDSQNLGMGFLSLNFPPVFNAPSFGPFDPTVAGWYTFSLQAYDAQGVVLGESAIRVQVGDPVPEPATLLLLGMGLMGGALRLRRKS